MSALFSPRGGGRVTLGVRWLGFVAAWALRAPRAPDRGPGPNGAVTTRNPHISGDPRGTPGGLPGDDSEIYPPIPRSPGPTLVLSDDEDTSGSLPEFIDAANDAQSTGTTLEDGAAPGYCDVGSPDTAGGDLGCSDDSGSNTSPSLIRAQLRRPSAM